MAAPRTPDPALLVVAAFSRHDAALAWARDRLPLTYGPLALVSDLFDFHQTAYYEATMGQGLRKQFLAFHDLVAPELLPDVKIFTNALEAEVAASCQFHEPRPLNLDPGLIMLGKFVLATTKDQQHRLYLRDGIFAEVTLRYQDKAFEPWPWTYADYREEAVRAFLKECRDYYRRRLRAPE
jgi:hypothetical protein